MIVYRIENEEGKGPYWDQSKDDLSDMCFKHNDKQHPNAYEDFQNVVEMNQDYVFGFMSREQLKVWFCGFIANYKSCGFKLSKYEIHPTKIIIGKSGKQIIFRKSDAVKLP